MMELAVLLVLACVTKCATMSRHELDDFADFLKKTSVLDQNLKDGTTADDEDLISEHAWEESGKFEGDLILNERQRRLIVEDVAEGLSRNGLRDSTKRWPDNEVVYYIQREHFSSDQVQAIMDGIDDLARASCVKFRPYKKGDRDAVVVQGSRRGCFSQVGYQGGYQVLNLSGRHPVGRGCFRHGTVVHEFLHTLGFYHMQSSPDRDDYIDVMWENIVEPAKHNFRKYNTFSVSDFGVGYDYDSVLHYSRRAFSKNGGDTLVPKQAAEIGQRIGISDKDSQKLNKMYCDADNNEQSDPHIKHKVTKKKPKNQPFQGHGIGYHKGKTVVIKLPAAKTFNLRDHPANHVFDYFSKAPKALPPTLAEGAGIGKKVTYTIIKEHRYERPTITSYLPRQTEMLIPIGDPQINTFKETHPKSPAKDALQPVKNLKSKELIEAFERLGMIIKSHVYPSQAPITEMYTYKYDKDFSDFVTPGMKPETLPEINKIDELFPDNNIKEISKPAEKLSEDSNVNKDRDEFEIVSHPKKNNDRELVHKYQFGEVDDSFGTSLPFRKLIEKSRNSTPVYTLHSELNVENTEKYKPSFNSYYKSTENPQTTIDKKESQTESNAEVGQYLRVKETPEIDYHVVFSIPENFKFNEKVQQYSSLYDPKKKTDETIDDSSVQTKQHKLFGKIVPLAEPWFQSDRRGNYVLKKTELTVDEVEPEIKKEVEKHNEMEPSVKTYDYGYIQVDDSDEDSRHDDGDSKPIEELLMQRVNERYTENDTSHSEEDDTSCDTEEGEQGSVKIKDHVKIIDKARTSSETDNSDESKYGERSDAQRPKFSSYSKTWDDDEEPTSFERAKLERYNYYRDSREQKDRSSPSTTARATPYRVMEEISDEVDDNGSLDSSDNEGDSNNTKNYRRSSQSESIQQEEPRFGPLGSVEKTIDDRLKDVLSSYKEYDEYDITSPRVGGHRHKSSEENIRHVRVSSIVKPVYEH